MSEKQGYFGQLLGVLYKPRKIFESVDEDDLVKGVLVVVLMAALGAYSTMTYMGKVPLSVIAPQLEGQDLGPMAGSMGLISGISAGIMMVAGWAISTAVIHGLGKLSGGDGSMKRFFAINGFIAVPGLLNQLLRVVDASLLDSASIAGYFVSYRELDSQILKALMGAGLMNIWGLAGLALLVIGLEENYKLGRGRAVLVALVPSLVMFALTYFTG